MTTQEKIDKAELYQKFGKSLESKLKDIPIEKWAVTGDRYNGSISTVVSGARMEITARSHTKSELDAAGGGYDDITTTDYNLTVVDGTSTHRFNVDELCPVGPVKMSIFASPLYFLIPIYEKIHRQHTAIQEEKRWQTAKQERENRERMVQELTSKIKKL